MAALKLSKLQALHDHFARRALNCVLILAFAVAAVSLLKFVSDSDIVNVSHDYGRCDDDSRDSFFPGRFLKPFSFYPFNLPAPSSSCGQVANVTSVVFRRLADLNILRPRPSTLCLGDGSAVAVAMLRRLGLDIDPVRVSLSSELLAFDESSFDFVFSGSLNSVPAPALLLHEMERILRSGGSAAVLAPRSSLSSMLKFASLVSSLLKDSDIVHLSQVEAFAVLAFTKRSVNKIGLI